MHRHILHAPYFLLIVALLHFAVACSRAESSPAQLVGKPGDCELLAQRVCSHAQEKSQLCQSARVLLGVLTDTSCAENLKDFGAVAKKYDELRQPCTELRAAVCGKTGEESDACKTVTEQIVEVPSTDCKDLQANSDVVVEQLERQALARKPLDEQRQATLAEGDGPAFGPANAKVTLVEFSDFECPYCAKAAAVAARLRSEYGHKVRFVFRHFPLPSHANAQPAAQAAAAAHAQGKFWEYHDLLFANQRQLDKDSLERYAEQIGLNLAKFKEFAWSQSAASAVSTDQILGRTVAVQGTPTLFLNGARIPDPTDFNSVAREIDAALAR